MVKFLKRQKRSKLTDEQKIKMAEMKLTEKINKMAEFIESQKDWNMFDLYCINRFIMDNTIKPQLKKRPKAMEVAKKAYETIEIREKIE